MERLCLRNLTATSFFKSRTIGPIAKAIKNNPKDSLAVYLVQKIQFDESPLTLNTQYASIALARRVPASQCVKEICLGNVYFSGELIKWVFSIWKTKTNYARKARNQVS